MRARRVEMIAAIPFIVLAGLLVLPLFVVGFLLWVLIAVGATMSGLLLRDVLGVAEDSFVLRALYRISDAPIVIDDDGWRWAWKP